LDQQRVVNIIESLANGVDPRTGAALGQGHLLQDRDVRAALRAAVTCLRPKRRVAANTFPANAGKPWNQAEDAKLRRLVEAGKTVTEIAQELGRTSPGIEARVDFLRTQKVQQGASSFRGSNYKPGTMDERCSNCGHAFGEHYNGTCPADSEA